MQFGSAEFKKMFWSVLRSFNQRQRSLFLRFCWARDRLPLTDEGFDNHFTVKELRREDPDSSLPQASTCFFTLSLPRYSTFEKMRTQILTAIENCGAYDLDGRAEGVNLQTQQNDFEGDGESEDDE